MNTLNTKSVFSQALSNFNHVCDQLVNLLKRQPKAAKAPADMEVDNLDWYRNFPIK